MAMRTTYVVQPFELHRKRLRPARQEPAPSESGALKKAEARGQTDGTERGRQVRRVVGMSGQSSGGVRRRARMRAVAAGAGRDKAAPVAAGESTVWVSLDVVVELGR